MRAPVLSEEVQPADGINLRRVLMRSDRTAGSVSGNILCAKSTKTKRESRRRRSLVLGAAAISMASYFAQQSAIAGTNGTWAPTVGTFLWSTSTNWATG